MFALLLIALIPVVFAGSSCPRDFEYAVCHCTQPDHLTSIKCKEASTPEQISSDLKELSDRTVIIDRFYIHSNYLETIGPNFFGNLTVIEADFSTANLTSVHKDAFKGQENSLERLSFSHTKLTVPPVSCIAGLHKLTKFGAYLNSFITTIDSQFNNSVPENKLISLALKENQIKSVDLDGGKFPNLEYLLLESNLIEEEPKITLPEDNKIQLISLSKNHLNTIPSNLLNVMNANSKLMLRYNRIGNIYEDDVKLALNKRIQVDIMDNPISCDCNIRWVLNYTYSHHFNMEGRCGSPTHMRKYFLKSLRKSTFKWCEN